LDSYGLQEHFEQAVAYHFCSNKQFFYLFQEFIEVDRLASSSAKLAVQTARAIYKDISDAPGAISVVLNRANTQVNKGKLDIAAYADLTWYLSEGDLGTDHKIVAQELAPTLKEHARHATTLATIEKRTSGSDLKDIALRIDKLERIGEYVEGKAPLSLDDDSLFQALEQMGNLDRLPSGADELDMCLSGGVPKGNLAVIIARPSGGKSQWLSQVSANSLATGKIVAHIVISEIPGEIGGARTLAPLIGMRISDITRTPNDARIAWAAYKAENSNVGGYKVFDFPSKTTVSAIREHVTNFYKKIGSKPDLIAFDYLGLASSSRAPKSANGYIMGEYVTGELRDWAKEDGLWIWTAAQSTRMKSHGKRAIIDLDDIADSYHIVRIADIVVTFNTAEKDPGEFEGQFFVAKHRVGPSGQLTSLSPVNWDTGMVSPCSAFLKARADRVYWSLPAADLAN